MLGIINLLVSSVVTYYTNNNKEDINNEKVKVFLSDSYLLQIIQDNILFNLFNAIIVKKQSNCFSHFLKTNYKINIIWKITLIEIILNFLNENKGELFKNKLKKKNNTSFSDILGI